MGRSLKGAMDQELPTLVQEFDKTNNDFQRSLEGVNKTIYLIKDIICVIIPRPRRKKKKPLLKQRTYLTETCKNVKLIKGLHTRRV